MLPVGEHNMIKVLFLIHDLGAGGAEKVLVNLVNHMDSTKFDITVMALFGGGVNEQFLKPGIRYIKAFEHTIRGNRILMKLLTPEQLHRWLIKEHYDIEVSYLEGPSARIISGCTSKDTKKVSWIHVEQKTLKAASRAFRSEAEAKECYSRFERTVCVSGTVMKDFTSLFEVHSPCEVLYNTVESETILEKSRETVEELHQNSKIKLITAGTLKPSKGYERLLRIIKKLQQDGAQAELYILGRGPLKDELEEYVAENGLSDNVVFLGYRTNPYKYVANCDLYVCASFAEGFSTAATEALIVGTPVCTVEVSGMKEMLGENNEYGIVTGNDEEALYQGIKQLLDDRELLQHYKKQAELRGASFCTEKTVNAVELMLSDLAKDNK